MLLARHSSPDLKGELKITYDNEIKTHWKVWAESLRLGEGDFALAVEGLRHLGPSE